MLFGPIVEKYGDGKKGFNFRQKITLLVMDILLLAELCYTMYVSYPAGEMFSAVFMRTYTPMFFPTVIIGIWLCRRFRDRQDAHDDGLARAGASQKI